MSAETPSPEPRRKRGPRPRHSREEVVAAAIAIGDSGGLEGVTFRAVAARLRTGVMSLYNYVPDKETLVYEMAETASGEMNLPAPSGDWRADLHAVARRQREVMLRHPWLVEAISHLQPIGPATLALLEFALEALDPTGLPARERLEIIALVNGFAMNMVRTELQAAAAAAAGPDGPAAAQYARLPELLATGRYPRFAACVAASGPPEPFDPEASFDRVLDKILDGLVGRTGSLCWHSVLPRQQEPRT
ncbi:MAG: TetR/AcrR family transcriptional regulator C-terminal domain-containing protein [Streptosporangiales bacterium]|nr:TetR/AcrR family transcriptional regulator C-terminal domain-containing protein [Streptosporangiales bacterium]